MNYNLTKETKNVMNKKTPKSKKRRCQTWNNYNRHDNISEINLDPSLTIPNQTMSIRTLLNRFTRGQSIATLTPIYQYDIAEEPDNLIALDLPDLDKLDKIERLQLAEELNDQIAYTRQNMRDRKLENKLKEAYSKQQAKPSEDKPQIAEQKAVTT